MHQAYVLSNFKPRVKVSVTMRWYYMHKGRDRHTTFALSDSNELDCSPSLIAASEDIADHQAEAWLFHDLAQTSESSLL
jgi:hypothetical protein